MKLGRMYLPYGGNVVKSQFMKPYWSIFLFCVMLLCGCGSNPEIDNYKSNMIQFFENISYYDSAINAIDPNSDNAVDELLAQLDSLENSFSQMAALNVPKDFVGVEELADEAGEYMSQAVLLYHQAFENGEYQQQIAEAARENYNRANLRLQYIISILHGEIPEEIFVYDDDTDADGENTDIMEDGEESNTLYNEE